MRLLVRAFLVSIRAAMSNYRSPTHCNVLSRGGSIIELVLVLMVSVPLLTVFIDVSLSLIRNSSFAYFVDRAARAASVSPARCSVPCLGGNPRSLLPSALQNELDWFVSNGSTVRTQTTPRTLQIIGEAPVACITCKFFTEGAKFSTIAEVTMDHSACPEVSC